MPPDGATNRYDSALNQGVIIERLDNLLKQVKELSDTIKLSSQNLAEFERQYYEKHAPLEMRVADHEKRLGILETWMDKAKPLIYIFGGVSVFLGSALGLLLWDLYLHKAVISFP